MATKLILTIDEEEGVTIPVEEATHRATEAKLRIVGRVVANKDISGHTLKSNLIRLLQPVKDYSFQSVGTNRFVIQFNHKLDHKHALEGCPWILDKNAVLIRDLPDGSDPRGMELNHMRIVVRMHRIPIGERTVATAAQIASKLGLRIEVLKSRLNEFCEYMRVKVDIDVSKSLKRGLFLHTPSGQRTWISFTYERLPNFCFLCGIIGHGESRCPQRYEEDFVDPGDNLPYGPWLRSLYNNDEGNIGLPLQATNYQNQHSARQALVPNPRDTAVFTVPVPNGQQTGTSGKENQSPLGGDDSTLFTNTIQVSPMNAEMFQNRKIVKVASKNRKKKADENASLDLSRANKRPQLALCDEEIISTAETAMQSRRDP